MKNPIMTLQNFCIEVIVKEFEQFFFIFCNTDDVHMKRKFEFLQRVYSYDIAFKLNALDMMKPKYIDLLVNKYLKELNTCWLKDVPWETVAAKFAEIGSNSIQKMSFDYCSEETPWENIIRHLINLEVMDFESHCSDEILKRIAQFCHNIVEINVTESGSVTNEGIAYLCMEENGKRLCPKLRKLSFAGSNVDFEGVKYLIKNLRSLEETDYRDLPHVLYSLHEKDLLTLEKVEPYNLTKLEFPTRLFDLPYSINFVKVFLTLCPHLKSLSYGARSKEDLNLISGLLELEELNLLPCPLVPKLDINNFVKLNGRMLTTLIVINATLSLSTLSKSSPCLKTLTIYNCVIKDVGDSISVFRNLHSIYFIRSTPALTIFVFLNNSPNLEEISLKRVDLSSNYFETGILKCLENCALKSVLLSYSRIDLDFIKDFLVKCYTLDFFIFENCYMEVSDQEELRRFAQLLPNCPFILFQPVDEGDESEVSDE